MVWSVDLEGPALSDRFEARIGMTGRGVEGLGFRKNGLQ